MKDGAVTGRRAVRQYLIEPLEEAGLKRKRGQSVAQHEAMLSRLAGRFAHMTEQNLVGLREFILANATGAAGDTWLAEAAIVHFGYKLQPPPPRKSDYALSLMRSAMGRRAYEAGYGVELLAIARRMGPPPGKYDLCRLEREGADNAAERERVRRMIEQGRASDEQRRWLSWYHDRMEEVAAIIEDTTEAEGQRA